MSRGRCERQKGQAVGHGPQARLPVTNTYGTKPSDENQSSSFFNIQHMIVHNQVSSVYNLLSV